MDMPIRGDSSFKIPNFHSLGAVNPHAVTDQDEIG